MTSIRGERLLGFFIFAIAISSSRTFKSCTVTFHVIQLYQGVQVRGGRPQQRVHNQLGSS